MDAATCAYFPLKFRIRLVAERAVKQLASASTCGGVECGRVVLQLLAAKPSGFSSAFILLGSTAKERVLLNTIEHDRDFCSYQS
jgi:hypothetical protein